MDFVLPSGAKLVVTPAPFTDASALRNALLRSVKGQPLPADLMAADVTVFKDLIVSAVTSQEVEDALFRCCERAVYQNVRVTKELFDDPKLGEKAREDFYQMAAKVVEVNCLPFFKQTFSVLKGLRPAATDSPASPSPQAKS